MQNLFIKSESKRQVEFAIRKTTLSRGTKEILIQINNRRHSKNNSLVFAKMKTFAAIMDRSVCQTRRYIIEAEEAGFLIVEDQVVIKDGTPCRINGRFWLSTALLNPADLPKVLAIPPRPSKTPPNLPHAALKRGYVVVDLNKRKKPELCEPPPLKNERSNILLSKLNNNLTTRQTSPTDSPNGGIRGVGDIIFPIPSGMAQNANPKGSKQEPRALEAKEVLKAYTSHFGPPGQRTREAFIAEYLLGNHNKQDLLAGLDLIASTEGLRKTTTSPNRLFYTKIAVAMTKKESKPFKFQHEGSTDWFGALVNATL